MLRRLLRTLIILSLCFSCAGVLLAADKISKEERKKQQLEQMQKSFEWWPSDARPGPVKDDTRGGYWWWPDQPGKVRPWGNRGYIYVYKIIYDYKEEELPPPKPQELRPSLLIKKIIKNIKIYFDYNKSDLRDDAKKILENAVGTLKRNPESSILITGNCDIRGSEQYNDKLGRQRADSVKKFMLDSNVSEDRIRIVSRGKLDAVAYITDLEGMQKDRNAQFMIAEVEEIMLPAPELKAQAPEARQVDEGKYILQEEKDIESAVKVSTREYIIQKGDTLWKIAQTQLGSGHRWKYLYEINKDSIKNPNKLKAGQRIVIPQE
ncbi:MAG: OmpA family protein [Candidatus Omnitrophota bacterium]|nr:OmpA family protein [Candidatus Omnitrophota bacterium]